MNGSENENNNPELTITEAELLPAEPFDFEFISFALGLITICNGDAAISVANIASIEKAEEGDDWILTLINDQEYTLSNDDMVNLDQLLKERRAKRKDVIKDEMTAQFQAQAEIQSGVQQATGVIVDGRSQKRGRFH